MDRGWKAVSVYVQTTQQKSSMCNRKAEVDERSMTPAAKPAVRFQ